MPITLEDVYDELRVIRALLEAKPAAGKPAAAAPAAKGKPGDDTINLPQPTEIIANPGAVEVPFGKNKGTRFDALSASSLSWYCAKWELREKNNGGGFFPSDVRAKNAALTLWHTRQNTLQGAPAAAGDSTPPEDPEGPPAGGKPPDDGCPY